MVAVTATCPERVHAPKSCSASPLLAADREKTETRDAACLTAMLVDRATVITNARSLVSIF